MLKIELSDLGELEITFRYSKILVDGMRSLPKRRWDSDSKAWYVPFDDFDVVRETFEKTPIVLSDPLKEQLGQHLSQIPNNIFSDPEQIPEIPVKSKISPFTNQKILTFPEIESQPETETCSVSMLNHLISSIIRKGFNQDFWVAGKLFDYNHNHHRPTLFFGLSEVEPLSDRVIARVSAVMFERDKRRVLNKLDSFKDPFKLEDGLDVRLKIRPDYYEANGRLQIIVKDIDPAFTLGKAALRKEEIYRQLIQEGIADLNLKLPMPLVPQRIGFLTSDNSAAFKDFMDELENSGFDFEVSLYPITVQGVRLERSILSALDYFTHNQDQIDLIAIIRGGGSRADLGWFDNLEVARAVAKHPVKIICGIGHQQDQSVLDLISHSEKTPSSAAAFLVNRVRAFTEQLDQLLVSLLGAVTGSLENTKNSLVHLSQLVLKSTFWVNQKHLEMNNLIGLLKTFAHHKLKQKKEHSNNLIHQTRRAGNSCLIPAKITQREIYRNFRLERLKRPLEREQKTLVQQSADLYRTTNARIKSEQNTIDQAKALVESANPARILKRGFALIKDPDGSLIRSIQEVNPGDQITISVDDGYFSAFVFEKRKHPQR